jgi:hypothetical protein
VCCHWKKKKESHNNSLIGIIRFSVDAAGSDRGSEVRLLLHQRFADTLELVRVAGWTQQIA